MIVRVDGFEVWGNLKRCWYWTCFDKLVYSLSAKFVSEQQPCYWKYLYEIFPPSKNHWMINGLHAVWRCKVVPTRVSGVRNIVKCKFLPSFNQILIQILLNIWSAVVSIIPLLPLKSNCSAINLVFKICFRAKVG